MKLGIIMAVILLVIGGAYWYVQSNQAPAMPTVNSEKQPGQTGDQPAATGTKSITLAEVSRHATSTDCWFAVDDKVYDVTPFIATAKHPGGAAILAGCGKDATALFKTRPMGSGTPHSEKANQSLTNFAIGQLTN